MQRRRVVVHGLVQGVYFRDTIRRAALRNGVTGWVRNRLDGAVEAVFEGPEDAVERLVDLCRVGPRGAWVDYLEVVDEAVEDVEGFSVVG